MFCPHVLPGPGCSKQKNFDPAAWQCSPMLQFTSSARAARDFRGKIWHWPWPTVFRSPGLSIYYDLLERDSLQVISMVGKKWATQQQLMKSSSPITSLKLLTVRCCRAPGETLSRWVICWILQLNHTLGRRRSKGQKWCTNSPMCAMECQEKMEKNWYTVL